MSKMSQLAAELDEVAVECGYESLQDAINHDALENLLSQKDDVITGEEMIDDGE